MCLAQVSQKFLAQLLTQFLAQQYHHGLCSVVEHVSSCSARCAAPVCVMNSECIMLLSFLTMWKSKMHLIVPPTALFAFSQHHPFTSLPLVLLSASCWGRPSDLQLRPPPSESPFTLPLCPAHLFTTLTLSLSPSTSLCPPLFPNSPI